MSNRNFDNRVIIARLQNKNYARNLYQNNTGGNGIINNPQNSDSSSSRFNTFVSGAQTEYYAGFFGGGGIIDLGGISNIPPYPPPPPPVSTEPSAPTITSILSGNTQLTINFYPGFNGGANIIDYKYSIDSGTNWISTGVTTSPIIITGLTNGITYLVAIRAVNINGDGDISNSESGTPVDYGWITNIGGASADQGRGITTDLFGNVYTIGNFVNSTFLNNFSKISSGIVSTNIFGQLRNPGNNTYIVKYNSSGTTQWGTNISLSGTLPAITTDTLGNIYTVGGFSNSTFINNYSSVLNELIVTSSFGRLVGINSGFDDIFLVKYNSSGVSEWATSLVGNRSKTIYSVVTDLSNNVYITGSYTSSIYINTYVSSVNNTISTVQFCELKAQDNINAFIIKYNSLGVAQWATNIGGSSGSGRTYGYGITVDTLQNIYVTGLFNLTVSTNVYSYVSTPSGVISTSLFGSLSSIGPNNGYVIKYDGNGVAQWGTNFGWGGNEIAADFSNNIYVIGSFTTSTLINSYISTPNNIISTSLYGRLVGAGTSDAMIIKYNSSGVCQWATNIGGTSFDNGYSIATDLFGNVYGTGNYTLSTFINSFVEISSINNIISTTRLGRLQSVNNLDSFIVKYNSSGTAQWATNIGNNTSSDFGISITTDKLGSVFTTGYFTTSTFINAYSTVSSGIIITSTIGRLIGNGSSDAYIVNYDSNGNIILP